MSIYDAPQPTSFENDPTTSSPPETERQYREKVAEALHTGADKARDWSERGPERASRPMRTAGDGLDTAAEYLETHNFSEMCDDVTGWAKRNPGAALAAAAATGFCIGVMLFRSHPREIVIHSANRRDMEV